MASRDIRSTKERVNELRAVIEQINVVIRGCLALQKWYDTMEREGGNNYQDLHATCKLRMTDLEALLDQAKTDLTDFIDDNGMTFQYTWKAGKGNIGSFVVASTTTIDANDNVGTAKPNIFSDGTTALLTTNNMVKITEAEDTANNGLHKISSMTGAGSPANTEALVTTGLTNNAEDTSMRITLFATNSG